MEDAQSFKERDSPEYSLAPPVLSSPDEEEYDNIIKFDTPKSDEVRAAKQNLELKGEKSVNRYQENDLIATLSESDHSNYLANDSTKEENVGPKIFARVSSEDDLTSHVSLSPRVRNGGSVAHVNAKIPSDYVPSRKLNDRSKSFDFQSTTKVQIDTAAPIESVKSAVSKFGGIVDWKAHRVETVERRKVIDQELEKAQEEIPLYKQQAQEAEDAKTQVMKDLDGTKRVIEELKLNLERAQTEEQQAKQDAELAKLRVEELEHGIADEASFAAKAQLEVTKARHMAALTELESVNRELEQLRKDYSALVNERDSAVSRAREAVHASKEVERSVEQLTIELITAKQSLESAHGAHMEAEEHRIGAIMAKEQDALDWEREFKDTEEELFKLNEKMEFTKDLKSKLHDATLLLKDLKAELAAYMLNSEGENASGIAAENKTRVDIETAVASAKKELEQVRLSIESAVQQVDVMKSEAVVLQSELEKERAELMVVREREETASQAVSSLESEVSKVKSEIAVIETKEKEERDKMADLPNQLQEAANAADRAKALVQTARDEVQRAKEEADRAKAGASTMESRLRAAQKEIKAAKASEKLALSAINALHKSESARKRDGNDGNENDEDGDASDGVITLTLEEYYELSKKAHKAEEEANARVVRAIEQIEVAKASELKTLNKLEEVTRETSERKNALEEATRKAEAAQEGKLAVEQELRRRRAENEQKRKAGENAGLAVNVNNKSPRASFEVATESCNNFVTVPEPSSSPTGLHLRSSPRAHMRGNNNVESEGLSANNNAASSAGADQGKVKKKKKFFPRFLMFLAKKKSHSSKMA